jgi:NarL family two-component system sensor histidine kinase LiaS
LVTQTETTGQSRNKISLRLSRPLFRRFFAFFNRLQWKLTLAYTLFTVITILILGSIAVTFLWYNSFRSNSLPNRIADGLLKAGPAIAPYLDQTPPDEAGLRAWLEQVSVGNNLVINIPRDKAEDDGNTLPAQFGRIETVAIVDSSGKVLAITPPDAVEADSSLEAGFSPQAAAGFHSALLGETDPDLLSNRDPGDYMVATVPVFGSDDQVVGAIYAKLSFPIAAAEFLQIILQSTILPVALVMLIAGVISGVFFGFLIARGLTQRLQKLEHAADAWSNGNFEVLALDSSGDELGQLARRLNQMAVQLDNLVESEQELAALEERNRLARDLHDSVKQQIFATAMQVGAARASLEHNPQAAKTHLDETDRLVRQAQQELTGLIRELRPAALEGKGVATALRDYVLDWSRQNDIKTEVRVRGDRPLSLNLEQALFRIAQEALANVARHSQAAAVEVYLAWQGDEVTLTIANNGPGFNVAAMEGKGLGLRSMRERIETLGGQLIVDSTPATGTRVTARLPIDS